MLFPMEIFENQHVFKTKEYFLKINSENQVYMIYSILDIVTNYEFK